MPSNDDKPPPAGRTGATGNLHLSAAEFAAYCEHAEVLEYRRGRPVLLLHAADARTPQVTRVWYPRRRFSSDWLWSYRDRFRSALERLEARGVRVPRLRAQGDVAALGVRFIVYDWLEGESLHGLGERVDLKALAAFVARLHASGVYFRGLHPGDIVACNDGEFAVVDVGNARFRKHPLPMRLRERNLASLCAPAADRDYMAGGRWSELVMAYCRAAGMSLAQAARLREGVRLRLQRVGAQLPAARTQRQKLAPAPNIGSVKTP